MNTCIKGFGTSALICLLTIASQTIVSQGSALASTSLTHAAWVSLDDSTMIQNSHEAASIQQTYTQNPNMAGRPNPENTQAGNKR